MSTHLSPRNGVRVSHESNQTFSRKTPAGVGKSAKARRLRRLRLRDTLPFDQEPVFDRVSFAYEESKPILREIDFTVKPGETVSIVAIFSLFERFHTPDEGQIRPGTAPTKKRDPDAGAG